MAVHGVSEGGTIAIRAEQHVWDQVQVQLRQRLDEHSFKNWIVPIRLSKIVDNSFVVGVPSQFFAEWLRDHYLDVVLESARAVRPHINEVQFEPIAITRTLAPAVDGDGVFKRRPVAGTTPEKRYDGFNPRYTFDRFVIGSGNRFAHAAAKAVAEAPARSYNPLFFYGGTGLGKTHLMQAIGHEVLQGKQNASVVFISSEQFTNQLIESIAKKNTQKFREKYRKVDILLVDDIHFIAGKEATQEEFFHTFNTLFDGHKQIVMSSDRPPKEIKGIEERLLSRFEWGLVTDIQPPDLETRVAILQNRADLESLQVTPDALRYIATYITSNIRELEGALITVMAFSKLEKKQVTLDIVQEVLRDLIGNDALKPITIESIQRNVAEYFDVRISDLRGRNRQRQVSFPRQVAMFLCKAMIPNVSLNEIGEAFGGKDHTTVIHACRKIAKDVAADPATKRVLDHLEKTIRS